MTYSLTPTLLNLFDDCKRCFCLHIKGIWQRPSASFPSLLSNIDSVLKDYFDGYRDKNILPPELEEDSDCCNLRLFKDKSLLNDWRLGYKGISWQDEKGNILRGAVDDILVNKERLIVIDYKTAGESIIIEVSKEFYKKQLEAYSLILQKNSYLTEDFGFILLYTPKEVLGKGQFMFNVHVIKIKLDIEKAEKRFQDAINYLNREIDPSTCK